MRKTSLGEGTRVCNQRRLVDEVAQMINNVEEVRVVRAFEASDGMMVLPQGLLEQLVGKS